MEPLSAEDVRGAAFGFERDGYDVDTVDELLRRVAERLTAGQDAAALLPGTLPTRRRGYRRAAVHALLERVRAVPPRSPRSTDRPGLDTAATLVVGRPSIHGAEGTRLGRAEWYANGELMIYDGSRAVARARKRSRIGRAVELTDPAGPALGHVVARLALISTELRRASLFVGGRRAASCRVERRDSSRSVRRYVVRDPAGAELARLTAVANRGASVRVDFGGPIDRSLRLLVVYVAAVPAFPRSDQPGMPVPQMPV